MDFFSRCDLISDAEVGKQLERIKYYINKKNTSIALIILWICFHWALVCPLQIFAKSSFRDINVPWKHITAVEF